MRRNDAEVDVSVSLQRLTPSPSISNQGRGEEGAAMSQIRKICMDIIQSAEEGKPPPPRAQIKIKKVIYHRSRNNPISPRDPNFTEIPSEFSQVLTYGLARSQAQTVQQATIDPSLTLTRRSIGIDSRLPYNSEKGTKQALQKVP